MAEKSFLTVFVSLMVMECSACVTVTVILSCLFSVFDNVGELDLKKCVSASLHHREKRTYSQERQVLSENQPISEIHSAPSKSVLTERNFESAVPVSQVGSNNERILKHTICHFFDVRCLLQTTV